MAEQTVSTEQRVIRQEMNGCIREIIETLPEGYRSVVVLSELEGMKFSEFRFLRALIFQPGGFIPELSLEPKPAPLQFAIVIPSPARVVSFSGYPHCRSGSPDQQ